MFILLIKYWPTCALRPQTTTKNFKGYTDSYKCITWSLETAAIPRKVRVKHTKGIANILAALVSWLNIVGIYYDTDSSDHQQEFSKPFELLPPVEQVIHTNRGEWRISFHLTLKDWHDLTHYMTHPLHRLVMTSDSHWRTCHLQTSGSWKKV